MKLTGKVFIFGNNIDTDVIIPGRYLVTSEAEELARYCFEDIRPGFGRRAGVKGSIILAGENFGSGSSREHAPLAIKGAGIKCVLAKSFSRIFLRNAINIGLPIAEVSQIDGFSEGDEITVDFTKGAVRNNRTKEIFKITSLPEFIQKIMKSGGWLNYINNFILRGAR
ncbi:MAG: 3-isopropylmalate dehydratase small subunit [Candidatus Aminicenantes bacterium 4484_214]|nr:MAG: 3-isopropylmalate dehydratase small subunit [Candidatus Aminicenantes bacterium 4484_214]RLE10166.1 MAG: 3-isopropylmalate dehydratase small subunit [Candidatus Aminicenantes bacterium]